MQIIPSTGVKKEGKLVVKLYFLQPMHPTYFKHCREEIRPGSAILGFFCKPPIRVSSDKICFWVDNSSEDSVYVELTRQDLTATISDPKSDIKGIVTELICQVEGCLGLVVSKVEINGHEYRPVKKWQVFMTEVTETLGVVTVEASSVEEAVELAEAAAYSGSVDWEDGESELVVDKDECRIVDVVLEN